MRVLFAEDDRQLRESVARGLREASYVVDLAENGTEAIALGLEHDYDVVILDILMAGASGLEVCRSFRAAERSVPILMLTALDSVEQRITGLDAGADDYLTKPFDFGELLARLRALTRRRGDVLAPELVLGTAVRDVHVLDEARADIRRGAAAQQMDQVGEHVWLADTGSLLRLPGKKRSMWEPGVAASDCSRRRTVVWD